MVAPALLALAPLLQQLAANGLSLIGNAIMAKGKDVIEDKLGVKIEDAMGTEEGRLKLLQAQNDHEEFLINAALSEKRIDLDYYKVDAADRDSARDMNARIQESINASDTAKIAPYVLDFLIVGLTIGMGYLLFWCEVPKDNVQILNIVFGALLALCGTVVNFHRGSSRQSQTKDETIAALSNIGGQK